MKTKREDLEVGALYYEKSTGDFFFTPDGVGVFWLENKDEIVANFGNDYTYKIITELEDA